MYDEDTATDEELSEFAARWLLRFHADELKALVANADGDTPKEQAASLAGPLEDLFVKQVAQAFNCSDILCPAGRVDLLAPDITSAILAESNALSATEALVSLLAAPLSRVNWDEVSLVVMQEITK